MSYTPPEATYYAACDPSINRRSPSWSEVSNLYFPKSRDVCQEHLASWMCLKARTPSWKKHADFKLIKRSPQSMATASITSPTSVTSTSTATVAPIPTTAASPVSPTRTAVPRWTLTVFASFSTRVLPARDRTLSLDTTMAARPRMFRLGRVLWYQMGTAGRRLPMEQISFS